MKMLSLFLLLFWGLQFFAQDALLLNDDTTRLRIGKKTILFVGESDDGFDWDDEEVSRRSPEFLKILPTIDIGANSYVTPTNNLILPESQKLMELDYKSSSFSATLLIKGISAINKKIHLSTGIGFNWSSYSFEKNVSVSTTNDTTLFSVDTIIAYSKNKLKTVYAQVPLIIRIRMGKIKNTPFGIQFGVIGGYKLGAKIKQKYSINETHYKDKIKDTYNINPIKMEAITRINIGQFGLYAKYSIVPLFETHKAPELHPVSVGLTIGGF